MTSIVVETDPQASPAMPRIAALTTLRVPFEVPVHPISHVSEIEPLDEVVLLRGRDMGPIAGALTRARSIGSRVPPVVVIAPELDPADIIQAFSGGPVGYSLEGASDQTLGDLLRLAAKGQYGLHPEVLRTLLRQGKRATTPVTVPLTTREEEIMSLLAAGNDVAAVADQLYLSRKTVRNNLTRIFSKLHVRRQTEAVLRWRGLA